MGRPKVKIIDDSVKEEPKDKPLKKAVKATVDDRKIDDSTLKIENSEIDNPSSIIYPQNSTINPPSSTIKKSTKPGKAKPRSKKYQEAVQVLDRNKTYPVSEAIDLAKKVSYVKFEASLEAHLNTVQTGIRGLVSLPFASGKKLRILAFGPADLKLDGVTSGNDETIESISKGKVDFDLVVTTPDWMSKLAKIARILGPRGLMPNPKNGTITQDVKKAVEGFQTGKTEYKTESKAAVMHILVGKVNQPTQDLAANIKALIQTVGKTRIKKLTLSPTMGPGVKVNLSSI